MGVRGRSLTDFLDRLSEGELVVLYRRLQATHAPSLPVLQQLHGMRNALGRQAGEKAVYKFLFFLLTGKNLGRITTPHVLSEWVWSRVAEIREMLDVRRVFAESDRTAGVRVYNEQVGEVAITRHALERYWQYVCVRPRELLESVGQSFAHAIPASVAYTEAMKRLLRHGVAEVDYMEYQPQRIRFVVSKDKERVVVTVEQIL